jgi:thioredoxin reductase (NADPH)
VELADGSEVPARSVIVATGVSYRRLDAPGISRLQNRGVYYGAAMAEASRLAGEDVIVVGGGNSAGQAAIHLARFARSVTVLIRSESIARSMSAYLITEIESTANIQIRYASEVIAANGTEQLESVDVLDAQTGTVSQQPAAGLFLLIGGQPFTDWLPPEIERDQWGYVFTGPIEDTPSRRPFETTVSGVFAVGDVRRDSVKRVASAVGEGAVCVRMVHDHLSSTTLAPVR